MDAFNTYHSKQHVGLLRFVTLLILVVNVVLIPYDRSRFDADRFQVALLLRLVVVVPLCVAIIAYTYSRLFVRRPDLLALPALLLGTVIIAYSVIGKDPGYGTLAVLFVYLYWCVQSGGLCMCTPTRCVGVRACHVWGGAPGWRWVPTAAAVHLCPSAGDAIVYALCVRVWFRAVRSAAVVVAACAHRMGGGRC